MVGERFKGPSNPPQDCWGQKAYQAVDPGHCNQAFAARYRLDPMDAACRIEYRIARREFDCLFSRWRSDHQRTAIVLFGCAQEDGHCDIRTIPHSIGTHDRIVEVVAIRHAGTIARVVGRCDAQRQRARAIDRMAREAAHDLVV